MKVCCDGGGPMTAGCYHDHCTGPNWEEVERNKISNTRKRRLLTLVANHRDTKQWYHLMYYPLILEGYVDWFLGHGSLTDRGREELERLNNESILDTKTRT